jgi:hypothetical protein
MLLTSIVVVVMLLATLGTFLARRQSHDARSCSQRDPELELIDPNELLFSLPTINDGIPAVEIGAGIAGESGAIIMHEDDWRQAEFLPVANRGFIAETLSQLASHRAIHAEGPGFREVFVRTEPPVPLQTLHIESDELRRELLAESVPLYFQGPPLARVRGGLASSLPDVGYVYGQEVDGAVTALGIGLVGSGVGSLERVVSLSRQHELLFVDWIRGVKVEPGDSAGFKAWIDAIIYGSPDPAI